MRVRVMVSFGSSDGRIYQEGGKYDIADDLVAPFLDAGFVKQILSPADEFVRYAHNHKFAIEFDSESSAEVAAEMKKAAAGVNGMKAHQLESMLIICRADKKVRGKGAKSVKAKADALEGQKPEVKASKD